MEEHEIKRMGLKELAKYMDEQLKLGGKRERTQVEIAKIRGVSKKTVIQQTKPFRQKKGEPAINMDNQQSPKEVQEKDIKFIQEFKIYKELEKVPTDAETVRSAFNMSKETTERLKKYSQFRRIPLQDLVELAVINLLEQYDKR
jgi:transposase